MLTIYLRGKGNFPGNKDNMFYDSWGGFVLVQADRHSVVNGSGSERYFVDKLCWWFVNYFYSEN
jgi:hypothetical protein